MITYDSTDYCGDAYVRTTKNSIAISSPFTWWRSEMARLSQRNTQAVWFMIVEELSEELKEAMK